MNGKQEFLSEKIANNDLLLVEVVGSPRPQTLCVKVERVYSTRKGDESVTLGSEIEIVSSPGTWGDTALSVGERALLFVRLISGRLYEDAWRGHMLVEEIGDCMYAIFPYRQLWSSEDVPVSIKSCSRQDPKRPYATAIRLDAMEAYLIDLICARS